MGDVKLSWQNRSSRRSLRTLLRASPLLPQLKLRRVNGGEPLLGSKVLLAGLFDECWRCTSGANQSFNRDERIIRPRRGFSPADVGLHEGTGSPPVPVPACVLRLPDARPPLPPLPAPGHVRRRFSAGPAVEDLCGLGPPADTPAVVFLLREGPACLPDRRAALHRAAPGAEEPRVAGARSILLAAGRGGVRLSAALRRLLLRLAFLHAQVRD